MAFTPGETFSYCNTGYNLLGFILEKVTGQDYWQFLGNRILNPLGMSATGNRDQKPNTQKRARGYVKQQGKWTMRDPALTDVFAAGAIVSTVLDLAKWNAALDSDKLLKRSRRDQMWTPQKLTSGKPNTYGFGWWIEERKGRTIISHGGSTSGFSASLHRFPSDKLAVIVLCNCGEKNIANILALGIADLYPAK